MKYYSIVLQDIVGLLDKQRRYLSISMYINVPHRSFFVDLFQLFFLLALFRCDCSSLLHSLDEENRARKIFHARRAQTTRQNKSHIVIWEIRRKRAKATFIAHVGQ